MNWEEATKKLKAQLNNLEARDDAREAYVRDLKARNQELRLEIDALGERLHEAEDSQAHCCITSDCPHGNKEEEEDD